MIKYVTRFGFNIDEINIERETEHMVVFSINGRERKEKKRSEYSNYFDTREEAKEFLVQKYTKRKEAAERSLEYAIESLNKAVGL